MVSTALPEPAASPLAGALHHPRSLWTLFRTEMWERFSYYGMRALLVLYLVKAAGYQRAEALQVYAVYTGLVYLTPIVGGYLADRFLGFRKSILIGGTVMVFGHAAMAVPSLLHLALGLLIVGVGFFKPNISSLVGAQYGEQDPRRDAGFTYFYMGINVGAALAPLVAGYLGERVSWHLGFAVAAVGMTFGVIQFVVGQGRFGVSGLPPGRKEPAHLLGRDWLHVALLSLASIPFVYAVLVVLRLTASIWALMSWQAAVAAVLAAFGWILFSAARQGGRSDFKRVLAIIVIGIFNAFFWMGFEQGGGTMNLFADSMIDRVVLGWEVPATYFQGIDPLAILALGPVISALWTRIDSGPRALSAPTKMVLALLILGLAFSVLALAQHRADQIGKVSPLWLVSVYVLITIGELCLSPIGLSMVTKVAPVPMVGMMMGLWFCFLGAGNYMAGTLESRLVASKIPLYPFLVSSSIASGLVLLAMVPLLKRWMHEHT